jgi:hypothetical protein
MGSDLVSSGGILVDDQGNFTSLQIRGTGNTVLTPHDALYAYAPDMRSNGTDVPESAQDVGVPRWSLADAATQRVKWLWAIPVGWSGVAVRFGWGNESANSGNVVWQFSYRLIYLGEGDIDAGATTDIAVGAITALGQYDFNYSTPASLANISTASGGLGDKPFMQCSLSRLGGDAADTLSGAVAVFVTTATRV